MSTTKEFYDKRTYGKRGLEDGVHDIRNAHNFLKSVWLTRNMVANKTILDIGCGCGNDLHKFKRIGVRRYTGVDFSSTAIAEAKSRAQSMPFPCTFVLGDMLDLNDTPFGRHDYICTNFALHYASTSAQALTRTLTAWCTLLEPRHGSVIGCVPLHPQHEAFDLATCTLPNEKTSITEPVITKGALEDACTSAGLCVAEWKTFDELYAEEGASTLAKRMRADQCAPDPNNAAFVLKAV